VSVSGRNPFESTQRARSYESWYETTGRRASTLERRLLGRLLDRFAGLESVLEVGCGTGHFSRWLAGRDPVDVVGADRSLPMLLEARRLGMARIVAGDGSSLPFPDGSFDVVLVVTVLEFVSDPRAVLREAARVSRKGLVMGALNRCSLLGRRLGSTAAEPWSSARLLSVGELGRLVATAVPGRRPEIRWRTTLWPAVPLALPLPWGGFIGMSARWDAG
jgi:SAM-dependent methyltransferase